VLSDQQNALEGLINPQWLTVGRPAVENPSRPPRDIGQMRFGNNAAMSRIGAALTCREKAAAIVLAVVSTSIPVVRADPPPGYQVAQGHYTSPGDPGWIYFVPAETLATGVEPITGTRDGRPVKQFGCGIGPDGTVGCDAVPNPVQIGDAPPTIVPPGANQVIASPEKPAQYRHSDVLTFTRNVDLLPSGVTLVNGGASCTVGWQGSVSCETRGHGFTHYSYMGYLH
jgi:hypothetical protein